MLYTLRFFSSKCSLFHNANLFGSCIIHILYTGCAKIKKNNCGAKVLISRLRNQMYATRQLPLIIERTSWITLKNSFLPFSKRNMYCNPSSIKLRVCLLKTRMRAVASHFDKKRQWPWFTPMLLDRSTLISVHIEILCSEWMVHQQNRMWSKEMKCFWDWAKGMLWTARQIATLRTNS